MDLKVALPIAAAMALVASPLIRAEEQPVVVPVVTGTDPVASLPIPGWRHALEAKLGQEVGGHILDDCDLLDAANVFEHITGVTVVIDPSVPAADSHRAITINGRRMELGHLLDWIV